MKLLYLIFTAVIFLSACSPASRTEQLDKLLDKANELYNDGYSTEALPYAEKAMEFSIREFSEISEETAKASAMLAFIYYEKRMFGSARKKYSDLVRILDSLPGDNKDQLIDAYQKLSAIEMAFEDIEQAKKISVHVLNLQEKFIGPNEEETIDTAYRIARLSAYKSDSKDVAKYIDLTVKKLEAIHGENTIEASQYLNMKLRYQEFKDDVKGRISTLEKLIKVMKKATGESSKSVGLHMNLLLDALIEDEQFERAYELGIKALKITRNMLSGDDPLLINCCRKIALVESALGNSEKMEKLLLEALKYSTNGTLNNDINEEILVSLSAYYLETGMHAKAEKRLLELLKVRKEKLSSFHPDLIGDINRVAHCYAEQKKYLKAQSMLEQGFDVVSNSYGKTSEEALLQIEKMAALSYQAQKYPQAITRCQEAMKSLSDAYPDNHQYYYPFYKRLSLIFRATKELEKATDFSLKALKVSEFVHGSESVEVVPELSEVVDLYRQRKMLIKAINYAERSIKILEKNNKQGLLAGQLNELAALYEAKGDNKKARELTRKALELDSQKE